MEQCFKNKQSSVIANLNDCVAILEKMTEDNASINVLVEKCKDFSKTIVEIESLFDKVAPDILSYGLEVFISNDEYLRWLIKQLDDDRKNQNLIKIIDNTLSLIMSILMCEISIYSKIKAKEMLSNCSDNIKKIL